MKPRAHLITREGRVQRRQRARAQQVDPVGLVQIVGASRARAEKEHRVADGATELGLDLRLCGSLCRQR